MAHGLLRCYGKTLLLHSPLREREREKKREGERKRERERIEREGERERGERKSAHARERTREREREFYQELSHNGRTRVGAHPGFPALASPGAAHRGVGRAAGSGGCEAAIWLRQGAQI